MPVSINGTTGFAGPLTGPVTGAVTGTVTGNVVGNASTATKLLAAPAFAAYQSSAQTLATTTYTKINLQTEEYDTDNAFDSTTNYRFQPAVAGYYQLSGGVTSSGSTQVITKIYKNGADHKTGGNNLNSGTSTVSSLVYLNGSSDYVELFGYVGAAQTLATGTSFTYFNGVLVKPA